MQINIENLYQYYWFDDCDGFALGSSEVKLLKVFEEFLQELNKIELCWRYRDCICIYY